ncbi:hypothetical protein ACOLNO_003772 [Vibrio parahaemolyticus]
MESDINKLKNILRNTEMKKIHYRMVMEKFDANDNSVSHDEAITDFAGQDYLVELINIKIKDYEYFEQKNGKIGIRDVLKFQTYKKNQLLNLAKIDETGDSYREQALLKLKEKKQKLLSKMINEQLDEINNERRFEKKLMVITALSIIALILLEKIFM